MSTNEAPAAVAVNTQQQQTNNIESTSISMMDLFHICLDNWKWFVLSLTLVMSMMVFYIIRTVPVYTRSAEILLKQDERGNNVAGDATAVLADMGLAQSATNIINEIYTIQSPALALQVVKKLNLDINYYKSGTLHDKPLYGTNLPVKVSLGLKDTQGATFTLSLNGNGKYTIYNIVIDDERINDKYNGTIGQTLNTKFGKLKVSPTRYYDSKFDDKIYITRLPLHETTSLLLKRLSVSQANKNATIISMSYKDVSRQRADDILNTLINVYNENWVKEKNQVAIATSLFIDERLQIIEKELGNVDSDISSYKSENLIPDIQTSTAMNIQEAARAKNESMELSNQLYMAKFIRSYLANDANKFQLLPANSGIGSTGVEKMIVDYNSKVLERNSLASNSSTNNPLVAEADQALNAQRTAIVRSIDNVIVTLNSQIKSMKSKEGNTNSQIAASPIQAKRLLSVERQQKVKEALYLFLLQKREENELSQAFTAYNTRVISPPSGTNAPTSPQKRLLILIAMFIGIAIPFAVIYLLESINTTIRGRKDIEGKTTIPFIGEIPYAGKKEPKWKFWIKHEPNNITKIVVREGSRNIINEAFRVLRTNIEFMINDKKGENVISITSYNPGSGKSFITMNLAMSFAIQKKNILVIDGDLRHGSTSEYINKPKVGLSNYLNNNNAMKDIVYTSPINNSLHVIPIGTIPPNPAELLLSPRFEELVKWARDNYDYVFIDCPPADIVADTTIIEKYTDRTIFIARAGLFERIMIDQLEKDYKENKFKNMSLILNGTDSNVGHYRYKYGYKYGYHSSNYYGSDDE